jgi:Xaa-Pro aminopeptidase
MDLIDADDVRCDTNLYRLVEDLIVELRVDTGRVGIAGLEAMPASAYRYLTERLPSVTFHDASDLLRQMRAHKSDTEVAMLRQSATVGAALTRTILEAATPGATDGICAGGGLALAATTPGCAVWDFSFASGPHAYHFQWNRLPQWDAERPYEPGDLVHPDVYGLLDGYVFDIGRTGVVGGRPELWQREIIEGAAGCVREMAAHLTPGVTCGQVFAAGKQYLLANGFTDETTFSTSFPCLGHGVGLSFEDPWIAAGPMESVAIEPNMVLSLEVEVARNGVAATCEDMVLVEPKGPATILTADLPVRWGW